MLKSPWLHAFADRLQASRKRFAARPRRLSRRNQQPVIAVECLETRALLSVSTLISNQTSDSGTLAGFTAIAGSDRVLVVAASDSDSTNITSVTFNGSPLTLVVKQDDAFLAVDSIWYLTLGSSLAATMADIVVTAADNGSGNTTPTHIGAVLLGGVNQTTPVSDFDSAIGFGANVSSSLTLSSTTGDLALDVFDIVDTSNTGTQTPGSEQPVLLDADHPSDFAYYAISTKAGASPSVTMSWASSGDQAIQVAANFQQSANAVNLSVSANAGTEVGQTVITVTATADSAVSGNQTVDLGVSGTNITSGDYLLSGAQITILSGMTTGSRTFRVQNDVLVEATIETATLTISNTSSGIVLGATTTQNVAITDDDSAIVSLSGASANEGTVTSIFTVTLSNPVDIDVTVSFSTLTTGTTQNDGSDFTAIAAQTVTFPANTTTAQLVTVTVIDDFVVEGNETIDAQIGSLSAPARAVTLFGGPTTPATGTVLNDDSATPTVTVAGPPVGVFEDGSINLDYTFTRTGSTASALTAYFRVTGTATAGADYTPSGSLTFTRSGGTVKFLAGHSAAVVTLDPRADSSVEPNETATLTLLTHAGYMLGAAATRTAIGTILNDDNTLVNVAVTSPLPSKSVAEDGSPNLVFTFTRSRTTPNPQTIHFTVGGTATFNTDYTQAGSSSFTATTGTVTFGFGQSTAIVSINPTSDSIVEGNETVILTVVSGTGYSPGASATDTGTITNDDIVPTITLSISRSADTVLETGTDELRFVFTRTVISRDPLTVSFIVSGDAVYLSDYGQTGAASFTSMMGTVTFGFGQYTATVFLRPINDGIDEGFEDVTLDLLDDGSGNYLIGTASSATGYIGD